MTKYRSSLLVLKCLAIAYTLTYLLAAFVAWDLDPAAWDPLGRFLSAFLSTIMGLATAGATHDIR